MGAALQRFTPSENNVEVSSLIWLDGSVKIKQESIDAQQRLRVVINDLKTFEREDKCEQYIKSLSESVRIALIVSGALGKIIVPRIHQQPQIIAIYVYCGDKLKNEQWAKQYKKVRGVVVTLNDLISGIKSDQTNQQQEDIDEPLTFTTFKTSGGKEQLTQELDGQFVHSQLLINCLLRIDGTSTDFKELIKLCEEEYQDNQAQLTLVRKFQDEYSPNRALRWYTRDSFVYRMLNQALRTQNIHLIFLFRFLIRDLETQLDAHQCQSKLTVYRGQFMWEKEFESLEQSKGQLISINSFLSTSRNRESAYKFLLKSNQSTVKRILFEIDANPKLPGIKPFADISAFSPYEEAEVLFMLGSIFQIGTVNSDRNSVATIKLTLCSDRDLDLKKIFNHMQSEDNQSELDLIMLGDVLRRMGKYDDAEEYYRRCLNQLSSNDYHKLSSCYFALGRLADNKGEYKSSLKYFNQSLELDMKILKADDPSIASTHNSIANIYQTTGNYEQALESYNKALTIFRRTLGDRDPHVAMCLNNIGSVYQREENYQKALNYYEEALAIRKKHLPSSHPDLGTSYNNIGIVQRCLGHPDQALEKYNLALRIYKDALPSEHPDIAMTLANIGIVYEEKRNWKEALSYYERAKTIYNQVFHSTHHDVVEMERHVQRMALKLS